MTSVAGKKRFFLLSTSAIFTRADVLPRAGDGGRARHSQCVSVRLCDSDGGRSTAEESPAGVLLKTITWGVGGWGGFYPAISAT